MHFLIGIYILKDFKAAAKLKYGRTFYLEGSRFFAAAVGVFSSACVFSLVFHLGATDPEFIIVSRVLGHVFHARPKWHATKTPVIIYVYVCKYLQVYLYVYY